MGFVVEFTPAQVSKLLEMRISKAPALLAVASEIVSLWLGPAQRPSIWSTPTSMNSKCHWHAAGSGILMASRSSHFRPFYQIKRGKSSTVVVRFVFVFSAKVVQVFVDDGNGSDRNDQARVNQHLAVVSRSTKRHVTQGCCLLNNFQQAVRIFESYFFVTSRRSLGFLFASATEFGEGELRCNGLS